MSTENTNTIDTTVETDDLDLFAATFFGEKEQTPETANSEETLDTDVDESDAQNQDEDTQTPSDDGTPETDESTDEPKKGNRYQERINEITAARRAAERVAEEAIRERDEYKRQLEERTKAPDPSPVTKAVQTDELKEPDPTAKNEDGTPKYPLGVYDPKYLQDNIQYLFDAQEAQREQERKSRDEQEKLQNVRTEIEANWEAKLVTARERYPDYFEKGEAMVAVFDGIDEAYGQYLADTIMEMDAGPDVFYYLSNNIDEAQKIVSAGPRKATIALAKLEAELSGSSETSKVPRVKTSKAPPPPPQVRGSAAVSPGATGDTDDLVAFSREFFKK
jgi:hypothetical protein